MRICGIILALLLCAVNFSTPMRTVRSLPNAIFAENNNELNAETTDLYEQFGMGAVSASYTGDETLSSGSININVLGFITLRSIPAYVGERAWLHPGGNAIGITIYTQGVLVVGNGSFTNSAGKKCNPSQEAGIKPGDVIISVEGTAVNTSEELQVALNANQFGASIQIDRNGKRMEIYIVPEVASDGTARIGAWVRDSTVGIGTLSFYEEDTKVTTALGHAVIDADTGRIITVGSGEMRYARVLGVVKGTAGIPGEIQGTFSSASIRIGSIDGNGELGIFGSGDGDINVLTENNAVPVAFPNEVKTGDAYILSDIDGNGPKQYSCRILKAAKQSKPGQKGLVIEITDERLLSTTGGIVQGMSGSPILMDGFLVGVVTHVFVNDPTKGYGVYAYWMYQNAVG
ncbi:MAG: SpoIVB peptidase [Christensenellaceae bacterium]|nr:SpoIVB peptidase [Christensenellaceae bacterium]